MTIEVGGLDSGECFIQLDNGFLIDLPFDCIQNVQTKTLTKNAVSLLSDLSDISVYHINKYKKTIGEMADDYQQQKRKLSNRISKFLFNIDLKNDGYKPYKTGYLENKLKNLKDRKIIDYIWYADDNNKGLLLLDNGYLITETIVAPHGTGLAGLNYFENLIDLANTRGKEYLKLTDQIKGNSGT